MDEIPVDPEVSWPEGALVVAAAAVVVAEGTLVALVWLDTGSGLSVCLDVFNFEELIVSCENEARWNE